ncbi:MAG: precorrin-6A reductase, partial [Lachnospiraceae bacterium]|nr:precorrin-6A reductase [Lachnospiraceae bacterium]
KKGRGEKEMANIAPGDLPFALKARKKGRGEQELANVVSRGLPFATMAGKMDREEMESVLKCYHLCIDATHPYAVEVTRNLKAACEKVGIRYIRVLRESVEEVDKEGKYGLLVEVADKEGNRSPFVVTANSASEASRFLEETEGNILLTTGSKELREFANIPRDRLYVRVLPIQASLEECLKEGVPARNIIAMFGPFTQKMNEATIEQYDIAYLVTKESGKIGGYKEKLEAARACGTRVIVIRRPEETGLSSGEVLGMLLKEK